MQNTARYTGSNLTTVLSATALAVATTTPMARSEDFRSIEVVRDQNDKYSSIAFVDNLSNEDVTDSEFVLGHQIKDFDSLWRPRLRQTSFANYKGLLDVSHIKPAFNFGPNIFNGVFLTQQEAITGATETLALSRARDFYKELPAGLKSPVVEEVVAVFFVAANSAPSVDRIDDMTTLDIAHKGRSLGVLIERGICAISSFSESKEIKGTFAVETESGLEEFKRVLFHELTSFRV